MTERAMPAIAAIVAVCLALLAAVALPAGAHGPETVTPVFKHALPNVPGKQMIAVEVSFPPGAASPSHTHPKSAFIYAYVLSGEIVSAVDDEPPHLYRTGDSWYEAPGARHTVTRNASKDKPARLLAMFVTDQGDHELVLPDTR
jgi:quercetin dioxygenase-like cupin family protein